MSAAVVVKEGMVIGECGKNAVSHRKGAVIKRSELMSVILKREVDTYMKHQLSSLYDLILELETENKKYITQIKVSNDSEKKFLDFIKKEMN